MKTVEQKAHSCATTLLQLLRGAFHFGLFYVNGCDLRWDWKITALRFGRLTLNVCRFVIVGALDHFASASSVVRTRVLGDGGGSIIRLPESENRWPQRFYSFRTFRNRVEENEAYRTETK